MEREIRKRHIPRFGVRGRREIHPLEADLAAIFNGSKLLFKIVPKVGLSHSSPSPERYQALGIDVQAGRSGLSFLIQFQALAKLCGSPRPIC
jgi:hypothetical protein